MSDPLRTVCIAGTRPEAIKLAPLCRALAESLAEILERLSPLLERRRQELAVVQGDTTTTLATALAARYVGIPIARVEAGIRCTEPPGPIPEELHRRMLAHLATHPSAPLTRTLRSVQ